MRQQTLHFSLNNVHLLFLTLFIFFPSFSFHSLLSLFLSLSRLSVCLSLSLSLSIRLQGSGLCSKHQIVPLLTFDRDNLAVPPSSLALLTHANQLQYFLASTQFCRNVKNVECLLFLSLCRRQQRQLNDLRWWNW